MADDALIIMDTVTLVNRNFHPLFNFRLLCKWLDNAHRVLDIAVCEAYCFSPDMSNEQILTKLLALNSQRATL